MKLSSRVVDEFSELCDRAHELWLHHRQLFDDNPRRDELLESAAGNEFERLSIISQEYSLLQIAKLHDNAVMRRCDTLGLKYMLERGEWSDLVHLEELKTELDGLYVQFAGARNKILAHNDLAAIMEGRTLGTFSSGADAAVKYFKTLQEFVDEVTGYHRPFRSGVVDDVAAFLTIISPR